MPQVVMPLAKRCAGQAEQLGLTLGAGPRFGVRLTWVADEHLVRPTFTCDSTEVRTSNAAYILPFCF